VFRFISDLSRKFIKIKTGIHLNCAIVNFRCINKFTCMLKFISDIKERLDKFLAAQIAGVSRSKIQKAIKDGLVLVAGEKILEPDFELAIGSEVELPEFEKEELKPLDFKLKVVYENNDLLVIDKPAGLVVHPAAGHKDDTLSNALISQFPQIKTVGPEMRPGIVHRLDEDTSGLLVVAKTQEAFDYLKSLFSSRTIEKWYLALAHGVPEKLHDIIDAPIGKTSTHQKMKVGAGKEARTEYTVIGQGIIGLDQVSLLKVKLHTGRTHQIRVHLSHINHPVFGDQLYGGHYKLQDRLVLQRQFLHAFRLKFQLADGSWLEVESELPNDLKEVLKKSGINLSM